MEERHVLVTGASTGIGLYLSMEFAKRGYGLILVARSEVLLAEAKANIEKEYKVRVSTLSVDLSLPGSASELFQKVKGLNKTIVGLVNNAGFGDFGIFHETKLEKVTQMVNLNVLTLTELSHLFLPQILKNQGLGILNIASTASFVPGPLMSVYYATKSFVLSFSEALYEEYRLKGISVTALCPGPTETQFQKRANLENSKLFKSGGIMDAQTVARKGVEGFLAKRPVVIPGMMNKAVAQTHRFLPRSWVPKIVKRAQDKRRPD